MKVDLRRKMNFSDQCGFLVLIRSPLDWGESGHPHLLGILPDLLHWSLCLSYFAHNAIYMTWPYSLSITEHCILSMIALQFCFVHV